MQFKFEVLFLIKLSSLKIKRNYRKYDGFEQKLNLNVGSHAPACLLDHAPVFILI